MSFRLIILHTFAPLALRWPRDGTALLAPQMCRRLACMPRASREQGKKFHPRMILRRYGAGPTSLKLHSVTVGNGRNLKLETHNGQRSELSSLRV